MKNKQVEDLKIQMIIKILEKKEFKSEYILNVISTYKEYGMITERQENNLYKYEFAVGTKKRLDIYIELLEYLIRFHNTENDLIKSIKMYIFTELKFNSKLLKSYMEENFDFSILKVNKKTSKIFTAIYHDDDSNFIYYNIDKKPIKLDTDEILIKERIF